MIIRESRDHCLFDSYPRHFAAFHALHRLLSPRHPPHTLIRLATMMDDSRRRLRLTREWWPATDNCCETVVTKYVQIALSPNCKRASCIPDASRLALGGYVDIVISAGSLTGVHCDKVSKREGG